MVIPETVRSERRPSQIRGVREESMRLDRRLFYRIAMLNLLRHPAPGCGFCRGSCYDLVHRGRPLVVRLCPCWKEEVVQTHSRHGLSGRAVWLR